jgi:hypothetical protein
MNSMLSANDFALPNNTINLLDAYNNQLYHQPMPS